MRNKHNKKTLTVFKLVMMSVVTIDSIKNLSFNAHFGTNLLFFYFIAIILFFIPSALVSAELATGFPQTGGVYIWVREAFGKRIGFLAVWIQWLIAITWFPTILTFIASNFAYLFKPELAENKTYLILMMHFLYWLATFLICKGMKISSRISTISALIGVIIPTILIILLTAYWIFQGNPIKLKFSYPNDWNLLNTNNMRLFITLLYSLMGMEIIAAHAGDVKNPAKEYPRALFFTTLIILTTMIPASLAIASVISIEDIKLTSGVIEAFTILLETLGLLWMKPFFIFAMAIGCFGIFYNWLLASSRYLLVAAEDSYLLSRLKKKNANQMPTTQLIMQGIIFTIFSTIFLFFMPFVSTAYWYLSAACAQFALIYYLFIFAAALCLRYKKPHIVRPFSAGNTIIFSIICLLAMMTCLVSILFGFLPPIDLHQHVLIYDSSMLLLIVGSCSVGFLIYRSNSEE